MKKQCMDGFFMSYFFTFSTSFHFLKCCFNSSCPHFNFLISELFWVMASTMIIRKHCTTCAKLFIYDCYSWFRQPSCIIHIEYTSSTKHIKINIDEPIVFIVHCLFVCSQMNAITIWLFASITEFLKGVIENEKKKWWKTNSMKYVTCREP